MEGVSSGEWIDASAESAGPLKFATINWFGKRDMAHRPEQLVHLAQHGGGLQVRVLERHIADAYHVDRLEWNVGSTHAVCSFVLLRKLVRVNARIVKNVANRADTIGNFQLRLRHQHCLVAPDLVDARSFFSQGP